jgi:N utilization substance protein B
MSRTAKSTRRAARELALNLLFQADVARLTLDEAIAAARENAKVSPEALETGVEYAAGAWQAAAASDAPAAVIINEAVDLAKTYGSEESGRFVNGVLSAAARIIRGAQEDST